MQRSKVGEAAQAHCSREEMYFRIIAYEKGGYDLAGSGTGMLTKEIGRDIIMVSESSGRYGNQGKKKWKCRGCQGKRDSIEKIRKESGSEP